jgi:hypothetical protein
VHLLAALLLLLLLQTFRGKRSVRPIPRIYRTPAWFALRKRVLQRDGYRCQRCGGRAVCAHHLNYQYGVICPTRFLVALCWRCHRLIHHRN